MKITDLLEGYDTSKARIEHPEDLVLMNGSKGAALALAVLEAGTNPNNVSVKPDGKPAIKWGRDDGGFAMGDKYMNPLPHSFEELSTILSSRKGGGREDLIAMYKNLWPVFEQSVPSIHGFLFGDLMYSKRPPLQNNAYHIRPNTVEYSIPADGNLGRLMAKSIAGIVVHTFLPSGSNIGKHINDLQTVSGIKPVGPLLMISDKLPQIGRVRLSGIDKVKAMITQHGNAVDQFVHSQKGLPALLKKFVNFKVKQRNFDNMDKGFLEWLKSNASIQVQDAVGNSILHDKTGYQSMWALFNAIVSLKTLLIRQFDQVHGEMIPSINGQPGHEGYIVHTASGPVKLIDRFRFSAANFES